MYLFVLLPLEASQISLGFTSEVFPSCVSVPSGEATAYEGMWLTGGRRATPEYIHHLKREGRAQQCEEADAD